RLHVLIEQNNLTDSLPSAPLNHSLSAFLASEKQRATTLWEVTKIIKALEPISAPVILLKGAAYIASGLDLAKGRLLSDIDLLVSKKQIKEAEQAFASHGWISSKTDSYDQRYYREWMHEIPPLQHLVRKGFLDVHHTILPPTAKYKPDPNKIIDAKREISPGVFTLCSEDILIHSTTHLFHEGEFDHGLRDLNDIKELLCYFEQNESGFWDRLVPRAKELGLLKPLYYGLHYSKQILQAQVPDNVMRSAHCGAPGVLMGRLMDWLFLRALRPNHPSCNMPGSSLARLLLYIRSHYLRMPMHLLFPHLIRKAWKKRFEKKEDQVVLMPKQP
ncbi:MAG: nucleotidyltransferase family protein, partial [Pseudomonadales bacterium]